MYRPCPGETATSGAGGRQGQSFKGRQFTAECHAAVNAALLQSAWVLRLVEAGIDRPSRVTDRNYIYATVGREIPAQPGSIAWQIFDQHTAHLLSDEYRVRQITKVQADTLEELVAKMQDVDPDGFLRYIQTYNAAVRTDVPLNPNIKDGRGTTRLAVPRSNWANPLTKPPFLDLRGDLRHHLHLRRHQGRHQSACPGRGACGDPGLFATGELMGGLYYDGYPGGAGLMAGAVYGRIAGIQAAQH
jgi:tricarballylate dehydrogenase